MLLCIDVGNTNITYGVYNNYDLVASFRSRTKTIDTSEELYFEYSSYLSKANIKESDIEYVMIDSVVPRIDCLLKEMFEKLKYQYYFVDYKSPLGIKIKLDDKSELGSDILLGVYQASKKYSLPAIVIDMGTATTIVTVNEKKELLGGLIYPGVLTSYDNLFKDAEKLVKTSIDVPRSIIGKNTKECIQSGMLYGSVSAINGVVNMIKKELNNDNINVILTGGIASFLYPYIDSSIYDENLLTDGLLDIYYNIIKK